MSRKQISAFLVLILLAVPPAEALAITRNPEAKEITASSAKISWDTDSNSNSVVRYGITDALESTKTDNLLILGHNVVLDGLSPNADYKFSVKSCTTPSDAATCTAESPVAAFKTLAQIPFEVKQPIFTPGQPLYLRVNLITISGTVEPGTEVWLYRDDLNIPYLIRTADQTQTGTFSFNVNLLQQNNKLKLKSIKTGQEILMDIIVDNTIPTVSITKDSPEVTSERQVTIEGSVNEPVTITASVEFQIAAAEPPKITGVKVTSVQANKVVLQWDPVRTNGFKGEDFKYYAIYRSDVADDPIHLDPTINHVTFDDIQANSGREYRYHVAVVDKNGRVGPKSDAATAGTPSGGSTDFEPPTTKKISDEAGITPVKRDFPFTAFPLSVPLESGDGTYRITINVQDRAGNNHDPIVREVLVDTTPPAPEIISPQENTIFFENVASKIKVRGKTEPNAEVSLVAVVTKLVINPPADVAFDASLVPPALKVFIDQELTAACQGKTCKISEPRTTKADAHGNFEFDDVNLNPLLAFQGGARQVPLTQGGAPPVVDERNEAVLIVVAKDQIGQQGKAVRKVNIGTCASGEFDWAVTPMTQYQSPFALSAERISENSESIYFYLEYKPINPTSASMRNAKVDSVTISSACTEMSSEQVDERFLKACRLLGSIRIPGRLNPQRTMSYHAVQLSPVTEVDQQNVEGWKDFFKSFGNEITFPFKVIVTYTVNGQRKDQTSCEQVSYVLDNSYVDFSRLPNFLTIKVADFLGGTSSKIQDFDKKALKPVAKGAAAVCLTSYGGRFFVAIYRRFVEGLESLKLRLLAAKKVAGALTGTAGLPKSPEEIYCDNLKLSIMAEKSPFSKVINADLKKCFPKVHGAWNAEEKVYQAFRFSCDRVLGKQAPAKWTEDKSSEEIHDKIRSRPQCPGDLDLKGLQIRADKCRSSRFNLYEAATRGITNPDARCVEIKTPSQTDKDGLYQINPVPKSYENRLYELTLKNPQDVQLEATKYAVKVNEANYLVPEPINCASICGDNERTHKNIELKPSADGTKIEVIENNQKKVASGRCMPINQCQQLMQDAQKSGRALDFPTTKGEILHFNANAYKVYLQGYTQDCFYDPSDPFLRDTSIVSPNPNVGSACCCVSGEQGSRELQYFKPEDKLNNQPLHESKTKPGDPPQQKIIGKDKDGRNIIDPGYSDMKWSYRYQELSRNNNFKVDGSDVPKKYDPNRYISGRDFPACFGQNNLFLQLLGKKEDAVALNPFTQHEAALQCLYITGIRQRLQFATNIMQRMKSCLIEVEKTGRGNSGACKELFSQQLCGLLWRAIKAFTSKKCSAYEGLGVDQGAGSGKLEKVGIFTDAIEGALADVQGGFENEYNNAQLNQYLGTSSGSVARKVCLGALGYDWDFGLDSVVDLAYTAPFSSFVQTVDPKRTYLTLDPTTGSTIYEYRTGYLINPGCELDYDIYLSCVSQNELNLYSNQIDCSKQTNQLNSNCDCLQKSDRQEIIENFRPGRRLQQNVIEDEDSHRVITSQQRYDHFKFVLRPDPRINDPAIMDKCFPNGHADQFKNGVFYFPIRDVSGKDIADCSVVPEVGLFQCKPGIISFNQFGLAQIQDIDIFVDGRSIRQAGQPVPALIDLYDGQKLEIEPKILNMEKPKCLRVSVIPSARTEFIDSIPATGGLYQQKLDLSSYMDFSTSQGLEFSPHITAQLVRQGNINQVDFNIIYKDNNNDKEITLTTISGDTIIISPLFNDPKTYAQLAGIQGLRIISAKEFEIEKDGAVVRVSNLLLQKDVNGDYIKTPSTAQIRVSPSQALTAGANIVSQPKTIAIEVFNLKPQVTEFTSNEDCDFNNPARYPASDNGAPQVSTITVNLRRADSLQVRGPSIQLKSLSPKTAKPGEKITMSVEVNDPHEPKFGGKPTVTLEAIPTSGASKRFTPITISNNVYNFEFVSNELPMAGVYTLKVTATSRNPNVRPENLPETITVKCANDGECAPTCPEGNVINSPAISCPTLQNCCKTP